MDKESILQQELNKYKAVSMHDALITEMQYASDMRSGVINPVITNYNFLNTSLMGGPHISDTITIAGGSGVGKTALLISLLEGLPRLNNNLDLAVFNFELIARKMAARVVSKRSKINTRDVYLDKSVQIKKRNYTDLFDLPIAFFENPVTVSQFYEIVSQFCDFKFAESKGLNISIIFIDHSILLVREKGQNEREMLVALANAINQLKKIHRAVFVVLSQLNDAMLDVKRMMVKELQYPRLNDIFGGRALGHISELVMVLMNPIEMHLPTMAYGKHDLPMTWRVDQGTIHKDFPLIYGHIIKARDGVKKIRPLLNQLEYQNLIEFPKKSLKEFIEKYNL